MSVEASIGEGAKESERNAIVELVRNSMQTPDLEVQVRCLKSNWDE